MAWRPTSSLFWGAACAALLLSCSDTTSKSDSAPAGDSGDKVDAPTSKDGGRADLKSQPDLGAADTIDLDSSTPNPSALYGFGSVTKGAASSPTGFATVHVTTLADSGKGSLRDALSAGKRRIVFDVSGVITLASRLTIAQDYLTIDGATAKSGITIAQKPGTEHGVLIAGTKRHTHDVVIRHVRFRGSYDAVNVHKVGTAILSVDADCGKVSCKPAWTTVDAGVSNLVLDHVIVAFDRDKLTLWGKVRNVTISNSLFFGSNKALLVSFYNAPYDLQRVGISIFRNAFIENGERNPQLRGWIDSLDYANNVIYGWGVYGMRIKNESGEKPVNANIVNNAFLDSKGLGKSALIYLNTKNPPSCLTQGQLYTTSGMGSLWVSGNILPKDNCDHFSTVSKALTIASSAKLPLKPASALCDVLAGAGLVPRTTEESKRLAKAKAAVGCP